MPETIRHIIAELRGDAWVVGGRVLLETSNQPDTETAALIAELVGLHDAVVSLHGPDGTSTTRRIRKRPTGVE